MDVLSTLAGIIDPSPYFPYYRPSSSLSPKPSLVVPMCELLDVAFQQNNNNKMAHELNMSVTGYMHIKDVLVPKHLAVSQHSRKKQAFRKDFLQESPADNAQQNKLKQLKPLSQIETIMRHFDAKFSNLKPRQRPLFEAKVGANRSRRESEEDEVEHRLGYLLQLPVIGTVRREAERYRSKLKAQEMKEREQRKAEIMMNFKLYMNAELKGHSPARKRLNTIN